MSEAVLVGVLAIVVMYIIYCMCYKSKKAKKGPKTGSCGGGAAMPRQKKLVDPDSMIPVDHSEYIADVGLQPGVLESHERFTQEIHQRSTGASAETVFSHDVDIVPWRGLRRPNYNVEISEHAREIPSVFPDQVPKYKPFVL